MLRKGGDEQNMPHESGDEHNMPRKGGDERCVGNWYQGGGHHESSQPISHALRVRKSTFVRDLQT